MCCWLCPVCGGGGGSSSKYDQSASSPTDDAEIAQLVTSVRHLVQSVPNTICKRLLAEIRKEFDQGKLPPFVIQLDGLQNDPQFLNSCIGVVQPVLAQCNLVILNAKSLASTESAAADTSIASTSGIIEWTIVSLHTTAAASTIPIGGGGGGGGGGTRKPTELSSAAASYTNNNSAQKRSAAAKKL